MKPSSALQFALIVVGVLTFLRVSLGPWGWVGSADAHLYQDVDRCLKAQGKEVTRACFYPRTTGALLPVVLVGGTARYAGATNAQRVLRIWSGVVAVLTLLLVYLLGGTKLRPGDGLAAILIMLLATPLIERASSGGPEIWTLLLLLVLAWLLGQNQRKTLHSLLGLVVSFLLMASHPYTAPVLILLVFVPLFQSRPVGPKLIGGRLWFGWVEARYLCAALGAPVLFLLFWPGAADNNFLWHRLTDLYREAHPAFMVGGESWVQGVEYASPPWWTGPFWVFLSLPFLVLPLFIGGISDLIRRVGNPLGSSEVSLILMALGWWLICMLQGSPVADGQDHRLILIGLLVPFAGRAYRWVELCAALLIDWGKDQGRSWGSLGKGKMAFLLFAFVLAPNLDTIWTASSPTSVWVGERQGFTRFGLSAFARPEIRPEWVRDQPKAQIGCMPWTSQCQKDLLPGLAALGFIGNKQIARTEKETTLLIVPIDQGYPEELNAASNIGTVSADARVAPKWKALVELRVLRP